MKMMTILIAVLVLAMALLTSGSNNANVVGTWVDPNGSGAAITFNPDGTLYMPIADNFPGISYKYTIDGNRITISQYQLTSLTKKINVTYSNGKLIDPNGGVMVRE